MSARPTPGVRRAPGARRAVGVRGGARTEAQRFGEVVGRLTARDRWLLAMLAEHSVLTTSQLVWLGWSSGRRQAQSRTRTLHEAGLLDRFRPLLPRGQGTAPWHWLLGPHGAAALASETGNSVGEIGYRGRARALAVAHRMTLAHDVACNDLVAALAAAPALALHQWWSAARCRRCFGHHVRPDAYLSLTTTPSAAPSAPTTAPGTTATTKATTQATTPGAGGGGWWEMFLEYDTGTESLPRLVGKLTGYHDLATATGIVTPVGVWITRPGREPGARRALADALHALAHPQLVPVLTATPAGPPPAPEAPGGRSWSAAGRVWLPVVPPGRTARRLDLATLAAHRAPPTPTGGRPHQTGPLGQLDRLDEVGASRDTSILAAPSPGPPGTHGSHGGW